jgi:hypothetical protein
MFGAMELMRSKGHSVALFSMADPRGEATPYDRHFVPHKDFKNQEGMFHKPDWRPRRFIPSKLGKRFEE